MARVVCLLLLATALMATAASGMATPSSANATKGLNKTAAASPRLTNITGKRPVLVGAASNWPRAKVATANTTTAPTPKRNATRSQVMAAAQALGRNLLAALQKTTTVNASAPGLLPKANNKTAPRNPKLTVLKNQTRTAQSKSTTAGANTTRIANATKPAAAESGKRNTRSLLRFILGANHTAAWAKPARKPSNATVTIKLAKNATAATKPAKNATAATKPARNTTTTTKPAAAGNATSTEKAAKSTKAPRRSLLAVVLKHNTTKHNSTSRPKVKPARANATNKATSKANVTAKANATAVAAPKAPRRSLLAAIMSALKGNSTAVAKPAASAVPARVRNAAAAAKNATAAVKDATAAVNKAAPVVKDAIAAATKAPKRLL